MKRWLLCLVSVSLLGGSAFAKGKDPAKVDPQNVPGTVKWLCQNFELGLSGGKYKKCGGKDESAENDYHQCLEVLNSGLGQKRLTFSGAAAQKCITAEKTYVDKPNQESRDAMHATCRTVVQGLKAKEDTCESPLDCGAGLACIGGKGSAPGKCLRPLAAGENCDTDLLGGSAYVGLLQEAHGICAAGLVCSEALGKPRVCSEQVKSGGGFLQSAGSTCKDSGQCKGVCESGKCKAVCGSG